DRDRDRGERDAGGGSEGGEPGRGLPDRRQEVQTSLF
ncbi:MAG: hypothetical protein QOE11_89, partial [Solirubrobacteraceae bacterium]|nr:hypothetical protein [Solirubrobacteraceae bacterium]